ncbi:MAG: universal stress protein [Thermodesulfobacteriota bacterium]
MPPKKILFCADFSENSEPARQLALDYAKAFGAELLIVHVIESARFPGYLDWAGDEMDQILDRTKESAKQRLDALAAESGPVDKPVKVFCEIGSAANTIVALAAKESVDLVVIGTHGRTGVKHLVMGSIARSVLRMAHRPVLIVEGPTLEAEEQFTAQEFPPVP